MHCSQVFRSSVPSDLLPSSPGGCRQAPLRVNTAALDQRNGGSAPVAECHIEGAVRQRFARRAHPRRHVAGAGPLSGEGRTMRDPELVARAQRAATRLESAWEQWRALHGLAVAPGQPVVSYVGYSLKEPWGEPRVVIGIDADEAEYLASSSTAMSARSAGRSRSSKSRFSSFRFSRSRFSSFRFSRFAASAGAASAGQAAEPPPEGTGEYPSPALPGAPVGHRHRPPVAGSRPGYRRRAGGLDLR